MHVLLSNEEMEWVVKEDFNWHIKAGCPEKIRKRLERAFANLDKQKERILNGNKDKHNK